MPDVKFLDNLKISCDLPINVGKSKKELSKRLAKVSEAPLLKEAQSAPTALSVDCNDPVALGQYLFQN